MENMDKDLTVPKWVLIVWPKSPKIFLPNFSAQAQKFEISMKKYFIGRPKSVFCTEPCCIKQVKDCFKLTLGG